MSETQKSSITNTDPTGVEQAQDTLNHDDPDGPIIDLSKLGDYPYDTIRHIILDTRIKCSRIKTELRDLDSLGEKINIERLVCLGRLEYYNIIAADLTHYLETIEQCRTNTPATPTDCVTIRANEL